MENWQEGDIVRRKGTEKPLYQLCSKTDTGFRFVQIMDIGAAGGEFSVLTLDKDYELVERIKPIEESLKELFDPLYKYTESNEFRNYPWRDADGDILPDIDREVVVLLKDGKVSFAHRPNPEGWDGKSITDNNIRHYDVKTYDKGGWNIPDVKWWLDANIPEI